MYAVKNTPQGIQEHLLGYDFHKSEIKYLKYEDIFVNDPCTEELKHRELVASRCFWQSWIAFYLLTKPIELNVTKEKSGRKINAYARVFPRPDQIALCEDYLGGIARKSESPYVSVLALLRCFDILELFDEYAPEHSHKIVKKFMPGFPGFDNFLRHKIKQKFNAVSDDAIALAKIGALPGVPIIPCDKRFLSDISYASKTLVKIGVRSTDAAIAAFQATLTEFSKDKSLTDAGHPHFHVFYSKHFGVPLHFKMSGLTVYSPNTRIDPDTMNDVFNRHGRGVPFDIAEDQYHFREDIDKFRLRFMLSRKCGTLKEIEALQEQLSFDNPANYDTDIEHFVHKKELLKRGLNPNISRILYIMTSQNHKSLFANRTIQEKFDIAIEKGWWNPKTALRERNEMANAVREEEVTQNVDHSLSDQIRNCTIKGL